MTFALTAQEPQRPVGRHPDDFYATPRWAVAAVARSRAVPPLFGHVLEPSCGDGAILDVLRELAPFRRIHGIELDEGRASEARRRGHSVTTGSFFDWGLRPGLSTPYVLGNPPFSLAQEFVEHALSFLPAGCRVTFLLRLAFIASQKRAHLYDDVAGFRLLQVLPRRPSFTPDGKTDSSDYAWFTWEVGFSGDAVVERL